MRAIGVHVTIPISGLSCGGGGALTIERALLHLAAVERAYVNPLTEMAYVELRPGYSDVDELIAVIENAGFQAGTPVRR